jgi:CxxC motif-containing protein (DUF1111 family)
VRSLLAPAAAAALLLLLACTDDGGPEPSGAAPTDQELADQGGDATVEVSGSGAFAQPVPGLDSEQRRDFAVGNNFFNDNWVTAPASTAGRDGLGPTFNAQSCSSCHFKDGRAQPPTPEDPTRLGLLVRLSVPGAAGTTEPVPGYGDQLQDRAINGVPAEGHITITTAEQPGAYGDGSPYSLLAPTYTVTEPAFGPLPGDVQLSPRVAPAVFGVGLLEAVPEADILAGADSDDADGDGISGRPNRVTDVATGGTSLGRFGWKANVPTVEQQNAGAFHGDIGITSALFPDENCPPEQAACGSALSGGVPELDAAKLQRVTFYTRTLAVPARRDIGQPVTTEGERLFESLGCASCHLPELRTGDSDVAALGNQVIHPYTDLLLHDMGPGLADGRPDGEASGSEWRTAPLWGIGLVETVNGHTRFLHDGRARDLSEAILWHGGEAVASADAFRALPARSRDALIAFLESL